jgi:hypothetical protein
LLELFDDVKDIWQTLFPFVTVSTVSDALFESPLYERFSVDLSSFISELLTKVVTGKFSFETLSWDNVAADVSIGAVLRNFTNLCGSFPWFRSRRCRS